MASDIDRFSAEEARPTMARMTPKPVPAIPKPTMIWRRSCCHGSVAPEDRMRPAE
jgi:hypothetical protein